MQNPETPESKDNPVRPKESTSSAPFIYWRDPSLPPYDMIEDHEDDLGEKKNVTEDDDPYNLPGDPSDDEILYDDLREG